MKWLEFSEEEVRQLSEKYGVQNSYLKNLHELTALGYSVAQAQRVILRKCSANSISTLLSKHQDFIDAVYPNTNDKWSHQDLAEVAANNGGGKALQTALKLSPPLLDKGYTLAQIKHIAKFHGAKLTLIWLQNNTDKLQEKGFTLDSIAKMAARSGGSNSLNAALTHKDRLQELHFKNKAIENIASKGGAKALNTIIDHDNIVESGHYTVEAIEKITAHDGGGEALQTLLATKDNPHFSPEVLQKAARSHNGSKSVEGLLEYTNPLLALGFQPAQIERIIPFSGARTSLAALVAYTPALIAKEFTLDQIYYVVAQGGSGKALKKMAEHSDYLLGKNFTQLEIRNIAGQFGGSGILEHVVTYEKQREKGFNSELFWSYWDTILIKPKCHFIINRLFEDESIINYLSTSSANGDMAPAQLLDEGLQKIAVPTMNNILNSSLFTILIKELFSEQLLPEKISLDHHKFWKSLLLNHGNLHKILLKDKKELLIYHFSGAPILLPLLKRFLHKNKNKSSLFYSPMLKAHMIANYLVIENSQALEQYLMHQTPKNLLSNEQLKDIQPLLNRLGLVASENEHEDTLEYLAILDDDLSILIGSPDENNGIEAIAEPNVAIPAEQLACDEGPAVLAETTDDDLSLLKEDGFGELFNQGFDNPPHISINSNRFWGNATANRKRNEDFPTTVSKRACK